MHGWETPRHKRLKQRNQRPLLPGVRSGPGARRTPMPVRSTSGRPAGPPPPTFALNAALCCRRVAIARPSSSVGSRP